MKKRIAALLACLLAVMMLVPSLALEIDYGSLSDTELDDLIRAATLERDSRQIVHEPAIVHASPDKYTWYVQDYVGRNAAGFGYTSLGGDPEIPLQHRLKAQISAHAKAIPPGMRAFYLVVSRASYQIVARR